MLLIGNHFHDSNHNQNAWQDLARHLSDVGYSVITASGQQNKVIRIVDMLWTIWQKRKQYDNAQVDVFSGPAFAWAYLSGWLLRWIHKPFILTLHGGNLPNFANKYSRPLNKLLSWAYAVTSPSNYLREAMSMYRSDIQLIPNAIDIGHYPANIRQQPDEGKIIWLRAFHEIYNPSLVPQMIALLKENDISAHITMVGPDKGDGSLGRMNEIAKNLSVTELITVVPGVPKVKVPEVLSQGDIFINSTNFDNTPVSVIEAMAAGLCIVSTNVGGIPYLLKDEVDALLVPPDDAEAMANAVERILTEPGLAGTLSANARKKAEGFDWSVVLPQWEALIEKVINQENATDG